MPALCEVAMPAQYRVTTHEQPQTPQGGQRHPVQQRRQERPVTRSEPYSITVELAFEHGDLMAEGKELRILVPAAHRQQTQQRERVGHSQVGQSQQHGRSS
ncbi:hypothetical protein B7755_003015 [Streptomyces sp. NBS 14/10]|uniref:hypothetical protein n=1 Tax=Streptomyces sp. NBS 14/10 TaxID=1945643 RepID=UPI0015C685D6|nr:hypothetical protein [Streptomyces sp. NBS 14/10]KAK1186538.1 hypothetical protein B7755_003015 [Streptomyces sp. NBS 14/10]